MEEYDELAEILEKNVREDWAQILSDYFKVDISLVETLVDAYNEIEPDRFSELVHQIPTPSNYYKKYHDGQIIRPSEDDIVKAYEVEKIILEQIERGKPQEPFVKGSPKTIH